MDTRPDDDAWFFCFGQSAKWWDRGTQTLLFRRRRRRDGAHPMAFRSAPFDMPLPGPLGGVRDAEHGWEAHPATKAAQAHYGLPGGLP